MSVDALNWAFKLPIMGPKKAVLIAMANYADEEGRCWPSVARMALYAGVSVRTVQISIAELIKLEILEAERSLGRVTSRYRLKLTYQMGPKPPRETPPAARLEHLNGAVTKVPNHAGDAGLDREQAFSTMQEMQGSTPHEMQGSKSPTPQEIRSTPQELHPNLKEPKEVPDLRRSGASAPLTARNWIWSDGLACLRDVTGFPRNRAASLMGKLLKGARDDCTVVRQALEDVVDLQTRDPISWLIAATTYQKPDPWAWIDGLGKTTAPEATGPIIEGEFDDGRHHATRH